MNQKILYKFASRSRPEKFFAAIKNIIEHSNYPEYTILCSLDNDDPTMNNGQVTESIEDIPMPAGSKLIVNFGYSKNKIDAINRDMEGIEFDILVNMSDDMVFPCLGFDQEIRRHMSESFPDGDGVLLFHDEGKETKDVVTMAIMGKKYYDRFGYIYFQGYESVWCDVEMTEVAKRLGRLKKCEPSILRHEHPANGYGQMDEQYRKTEAPEVFHRDKAMYDLREKNNFFIGQRYLLSILICTIPGREQMFQSLLAELKKQYYGLPHKEYRQAVEILFNDNPDTIVGTKRNQLLHAADGRFVVFIDDDDEISPDYLFEILETAFNNPNVDCIGMRGVITFDGVGKRNWIITKDSMRNVNGTREYWFEHQGCNDKESYYSRTPNHISPVRKEIAIINGFPAKNFSEDFDYSMGVLPYLKKQAVIDKYLYHYKFVSKK